MHSQEAGLLAHYDNKLKYYSPASEPDLSRILETVGAATTGEMLDVGCGDGRANQWAKRHAMTYLGVDYSSKRIAYARQLNRPPKVDKEKRPAESALFLSGDLYTALPVLVPGYSLVWCCEVLEHLEEPAIIWEEMKRLVAPGGKVVCTCPVNMPYTAHLQVYVDDADIVKAFSPHTVTRHHTAKRDHFVFTWER